jgi:hypothetical protein
MKYWRACRKASGFAPSESPLQTEGVQLLDALGSATAKALSDRISDFVATGKGIYPHKNTAHLQSILKNPLDDLPETLETFANPAVDSAIRAYFGAYYKIHGVTAYRSHPTESVRASWLWHIDNDPPTIKKLMVYLTESGEHSGATRFLDAQTSAAFKKAGYYGRFENERVEDLAPFAEAHGLPFEPRWFEVKAGSALFFDNNLIHRAVPPEGGYRDVITFVLMPSNRPWTAQVTTSAAYPKNPRI